MSLGCSTGDVRMVRLRSGIALLNEAWRQAEGGETSWLSHSASNTCERVGDRNDGRAGESLSDCRDLSGGGSDESSSGGHRAGGGDGTERRERVGHGERIGSNSASGSWIDSNSPTNRIGRGDAESGSPDLIRWLQRISSCADEVDCRGRRLLSKSH